MIISFNKQINIAVFITDRPSSSMYTAYSSVFRGFHTNAFRFSCTGHLLGVPGSIAVTERVIKTLKYEWLTRVSFIGGFDHLVTLREEFEDWYNT